MSDLNEQRLVELVTEEVQRALAEAGKTKSGAPSACGTGVGPRDAGPGRGSPALRQPHTPLKPTPKAPCKVTEKDCVACGWSVSRRPEDTRKIVKLGACRISARPEVGAAVAPDIAGYIDHTLLKAETTLEQLDELCAEAAKYNFASVCINPVHVRYCKRHLQGSGVMVVTVVGFPLGATSTAAKVAETRKAVEDGADEIDMVINIGLLKSTSYLDVQEDIRRVVKAAHPKHVKVIIETSKLSREEKVIASALSKAAGAHFVKTSTGFGGGGATAEDVALMKQVVGRDIEVKASGGVRNLEDAVKMIEAGATRIGASASVAIVSGKTVKSTGY